MSHKNKGILERRSWGNWRRIWTAPPHKLPLGDTEVQGVQEVELHKALLRHVPNYEYLSETEDIGPEGPLYTLLINSKKFAFTWGIFAQVDERWFPVFLHLIRDRSCRECCVLISRGCSLKMMY